MSKHTPGPWNYSLIRFTSEKEDGRHVTPNVPVFSVDSDDGRVTTIEGSNIAYSTFRDMTEQIEANARLIASAPEMLDRLKKALCYLQAKDFGPNCRAICEELRETIMKAEGLNME